jgi:tetratricopeptide (TPR) repeat protein
MNAIGYQLLSEENTDAAIAIFKLNVGEFPESSNTYDSLGEGYMKQGNNEKAIVNYKKSVELNPNNTNGIEILKTLGEDVSSFEKDLIISEDILKLYDGKYELTPNFILEISHAENQLFLQATGQPKSEIFASAETEFYSKIVNAQITFNKDDTGKIVSLTLHQGGDHLAKKIE